MSFRVTAILLAVYKGLYFCVVVYVGEIHTSRSTKDIMYTCINTFWVDGICLLQYFEWPLGKKK